MFEMKVKFLGNGNIHKSKQYQKELVEYRMVEPARLKPWRAGTGLAVADWMRNRGLPFEFVDLPGARPRPPRPEGVEG